MVMNRNEHTRPEPAKQGVQDVLSEPNEIGASTPYGFEGKNLTAYGGLLPVATMLENLGFRQLVEGTLTVQRRTKAMSLYQFVLPWCWPATSVSRGCGLPDSLAHLPLHLKHLPRYAQVQRGQEPGYNNQMGGRKSYNPKNKGKKSYQPILTFVAETKEYLAGALRKGDRPTGEEIALRLQSAFAALPATVKRVYGRADSGFYCWEAVVAYEKRNCRFILVARKTSRLVDVLKAADWKASPRTDALLAHPPAEPSLDDLQPAEAGEVIGGVPWRSGRSVGLARQGASHRQTQDPVQNS